MLIHVLGCIRALQRRSSKIRPQARQDADKVIMHGMARSSRIALRDSVENLLVLQLGLLPYVPCDEMGLHTRINRTALAQAP